MRDGGGSEAARAELCARVSLLAHGLTSASAPLLAQELDDIRRIAMRHGIGPALTVIHALDLALARGERGPMVRGWLEILREACGCDRDDAVASEAFAAALSVRLAG